MQSGESTLQAEENRLAIQLGKLETALAEAGQQIELLETGQRDFSAAKTLRKRYLDSAEQSR